MTGKATAQAILLIVLLASLMAIVWRFGSTDDSELIYVIVSYVAGAFTMAAKDLFNPNDDNTPKGKPA